MKRVWDIQSIKVGSSIDLGKVKLEVFSEDIPCTVYGIVVEQSDPEALFNSFQ